MNIVLTRWFRGEADREGFSREGVGREGPSGNPPGCLPEGWAAEAELIDFSKIISGL